MDFELTFFLIVATVTLAACRKPPLLSAFNESETLRTNEGPIQTQPPPDYIQLYQSPLVHWNAEARVKRSPWGGWGQNCGGNNCGGCGNSGCGTQVKVIYVPLVTQKQNNCGGGGCGWVPPPPPPPPRNHCGGGGCGWASPPKKSCGGGCCSGSCGGGGQQTGSYSTSFSTASASAYSSSSSSSGGYGGGWYG